MPPPPLEAGLNTVNDRDAIYVAKLPTGAITGLGKYAIQARNSRWRSKWFFSGGFRRRLAGRIDKIEL